MNNLVIDLSGYNDISAIAKISDQYHPRIVDKLIESLKEQVRLNTIENSHSFIFSCYKKGRLIAFAKLFHFQPEMDVDFPSPLGWYLNGLIVDPDFRRQGAARNLLMHRENFAKQRGASVLYSIVACDNKISIAYHEALGFKEHSRAEGFLKVRLKCAEGILFYKDITTS